MRILFLTLLSVSLFGCSSAVKRTKYSDKTLRVIISPDSIDSNNHVAIQQALVETGKVFVVDRSMGFEAINQEQQRQHLTMSDRFENREKYAQWGKMYGAGGVVTAHVQCVPNGTGNVLQAAFHLATLASFWSQYKCTQYLEILDTNTTEIVASVKREIKADNVQDLSWADIAEDLVDSYPEVFINTANHRILEKYKDVSAEEDQRFKERQISSEEK